MVRMLPLLSMTVAAVAEDDAISLMQKHTRVVTRGERIIAAVAANHGSDTICVDVTAGNVAPMSGSFSAMTSQQAVVVAAGAIAESKGSFCVPKQELLLLQRTLGLHTAEEFEAAIDRKDPETTTTTTTTMSTDAANKKVWVEQCPKVSALLQTVDATVSKKKGVAAPELTDDQKQVCTCRSFLQESVHNAFTLAKTTQKEELLQMLDGTVSKKGEDPVGTENYALFSICHRLQVGTEKEDDWVAAAALVKGSWACGEPWAIEGACLILQTYDDATMDEIEEADKKSIDTAATMLATAR